MGYAHDKEKTVRDQSDAIVQGGLAVDIEAAVRVVHDRTAVRPEVALVLGSGLGGLADQVADDTTVPYRDIPNFPLSTAPGHSGKLVVGSLEGCPVIAMAGRAHLYEGYSANQVVFGVRVMAELGARVLIITNAAGGVNEEFRPGMFMLISDHINLTGRNPLIGPNGQASGPRFPDMSDAYSARLRAHARNAAVTAGIPLVEGVYLGLLGPNYETPAEIRMARILGADAVGMSTVMEVIAANHLGMRVLGVSCITNMAAGMVARKLTEEEVLETTSRVQADFARLIRATVSSLSQRGTSDVQNA